MATLVATLKMSDGIWKGLIAGQAKPGCEAIRVPAESLVAAHILNSLLMGQEAEVDKG